MLISHWWRLRFLLAGWPCNRTVNSFPKWYDTGKSAQKWGRESQIFNLVIFLTNTKNFKNPWLGAPGTFFDDEISKLFFHSYGPRIPKWNFAHHLWSKQAQNIRKTPQNTWFTDPCFKSLQTGHPVDISCNNLQSLRVLFLEALRADSVDSGSEKNCWG